MPSIEEIKSHEGEVELIKFKFSCKKSISILEFLEICNQAIKLYGPSAVDMKTE